MALKFQVLVVLKTQPWLLALSLPSLWSFMQGTYGAIRYKLHSICFTIYCIFTQWPLQSLMNITSLESKMFFYCSCFVSSYLKVGGGGILKLLKQFSYIRSTIAYDSTYPTKKGRTWINHVRTRPLNKNATNCQFYYLNIYLNVCRLNLIHSIYKFFILA